MRTMKLGTSDLKVPVIAVGCLRITGLNQAEAERFVQTALDKGANFFDHADKYGDGECEQKFADAIHMTGAIRDRVILQSKCGIRDGVAFDLSR